MDMQQYVGVTRASVVAAFVFALASPVSAADLPPPIAPPPTAPAVYIPIAPTFGWTGFYLGGNAGWGWSWNSMTDSGPGIFGQVFPVGTVTNLSQNGWLAGGQVGYNYQISQFVVGVEADADATGIKNSQSINVGTLTGSATYKNDIMGTLTARFGYAIDRVLLYGKLGGAWTRDNYNGSASDGSGVSGLFNRWGGAFGAGLEYAVINNVTLKIEYDYLYFGTQNETLNFNATDRVTGTITGDPNNVKLSASVVKAGVNFLFH
jgi:outer membrane immunogenic protein